MQVGGVLLAYDVVQVIKRSGGGSANLRVERGQNALQLVMTPVQDFVDKTVPRSAQLEGDDRSIVVVGAAAHVPGGAKLVRHPGDRGCIEPESASHTR